MGRQQLIMEYPPKTWVCPGCGKKHSKPHYSLPDQIDYSIRPGETGRILFNRRDKKDQLSEDTFIDNSKPSWGEQIDEEGNQRPIFCPHCGYENDVLMVIRMGELPDLVDRFFMETKFKKIPKTWRKIIGRFLDWYKRRQEQ